MTAGTPTPRGASAPAAGALRVGLDVSIANLLVYAVSQVIPAEALADATNIIVILCAAGLGALGKMLRDKGNPIGQVI